ncbi:TIGR02281 family clan AA aspartic protease [Asticcacaulis sp. EMRT-3]|uniref:TIGR02281 family clan AA aspartic protease n=1 Tax=Asticcacaulis sp. EMRT-3 TaxID=3040349 RepID=UPI0024AFC9D6|nr:TIGR02281 family clan AA aspartic protease [Asticcacaulis sp. EMRT-3]MDI7776275.1 TIGR02281 family clan AA aspartic protease [Asticcacaulis sp. EMRT-3]
MIRSAIVLGSAVFCAVLAGSGVLSLDPHPEIPASVASASVTTAVANLSASVSDSHVTAIPKAADGHFWANASVNDHAVHFLVDTGATVVALTPADAQRLGFDARTLTYDHKVATANGQVLAASVTLASVEIGQSTVSDVPALVLKDGLSTSLLGMSYLGRLSRIEATPSSLILHP